MSYVLFGVFVALVMLNVPIAVSLGLATLSAIFIFQTVPLMVVAQKMFTATDSFPLMAIPFFMIAGALMEKGGISKRLIHLANAVIGSLSGGLALVTVVASMFFAAISGSAPATVAAIGSLMIPAMVRQGYNQNFATATQASSGYIGVIIPPSIPMITYGVVTGASIGKLFMAGLIPGLIMGLALMIVAYVTSRKRGYVGSGQASLKESFIAFKDAILALLMPIIILGGIYGGVFTPTEAANIAVVYGAIISFFVYKELSLKDIPEILRISAINSSMVMLLIATATAFGLLLTRQQIPEAIATFFIQMTDNPLILLLAINLMLLFIGTFLETNAAIIILAPIFYPVIVKMGIDPVHFGIVMVINLAIGMITPPLGVNLFVACGITKIKIEQVIRANWMYFFISLLALALLTYVPAITLFLPDLLGN
jgi:C4-dicarboxylate transporter DctM subunit